MKTALVFLLKQWPVWALLWSIFSTWSLFNAHQDNKQLARDIELLRDASKAADLVFVEHRETDNRLMAENAARTAGVVALPDDGCLDRDLPGTYVRVRD